jgi:hypothetical protein
MYGLSDKTTDGKPLIFITLCILVCWHLWCGALAGSPKEKDGDSALENTSGITLLDNHEKGLLTDKAFLNAFGKIDVFYSTPFGDHKDGGGRLFALPARDKTAYLPVFTSRERTIEFYEKAGRQGFVIAEGSFVSFLETIKKINTENTPIKFGAVIEPGSYGVTVDAAVLDTVINMMK